MKHGTPSIRFFPVIHTIGSISHAEHNLHMAKEAGAHGVFLINHHQAPEGFYQFLREFRASIPSDFVVGVNILGEHALKSVKQIPAGYTAFWTDNAGIWEESSFVNTNHAVQIRQDFKAVAGSNAEYFGSIAFKGQKQPNNLELVTATAGTVLDVVVTSGVATGSAPDEKKIDLMREQLPSNKRFAVASGTSPENVARFIALGVTDFLVASSLLPVPDGFDFLEYRLQQYVDAIAKATG